MASSALSVTVTSVAVPLGREGRFRPRVTVSASGTALFSPRR
ncbi:MAG: hypothetical protein OXU61_04625 [Gammaproteobacteria bacterium]|nr:hypothetical protein [Gammaproteobacteria bacterium]